MTQKELKLFNLLGKASDKIGDESPANLNTLESIYKAGNISGKVIACLIIRRYLSGDIDSKELIKLLIKS